MTPSPLFDWLASRAPAGRYDLAQTIRILIHRSDPALLTHLPFEEDAVFLEPGLFAHFAAGARGGERQVSTLRQILFSHLSDGAASDVPVRADRDGRIHLPRLGTIQAPGPGAYRLARGPSGALSLSREGQPVRHTLTPAALVGEIEFLTAMPAPFRFLVPDAEEQELACTPPQFAALGATALAALDDALPACSACLRAHLRTVVATAAPGINSFAAPPAHGAIFLAATQSPTIPALIEDLFHQTGHVVFTAAARDPGALLAGGGTGPMAPHSGNPADPRTLHDALHGLVTEALMVAALAHCLALPRWTPRERHELTGRLANIAIRAIADFNAFADPALVTRAGAELLGILSRTIYPLLSAQAGPIAALELANQPYSFDYALFRAANPEAVGSPAHV